MVWGDLADIVKFVVVTGAKTLCKVALNRFSAGLGAVVDFVDAAYCFNNGNDEDGVINILSGIAGISMHGHGTVGSSGEAMTLRNFFQNTGLSVISSGGHQTLETVCEGWIQDGITEALRCKPIGVAFDLTKGSVKRGAGAEFLKDLGFALVKGSIRRGGLDYIHYGNNGFDMPELRRISESYESCNVNSCMISTRPWAQVY